jgi:molybdenum cofactor cytidylyltransferase
MHRAAVLVLAAGRSTRFSGPGAHKLLAALGAAPVVRWSVQHALAAAVGDVVVVTGADAAAVEAAISDLPVRTVRAGDFADGMSASLRAGLNAVRGTVDALIVALADQPTVRPDAFRRVVAEWIATGASIVTPRYRESTAPAHPTLFSSAVFDELLELQGDTGARSVIGRVSDRVAVAVMDWPPPRDVDTADDLERVAAELRQRATADAGHDSRTTPMNSTSNR